MKNHEDEEPWEAYERHRREEKLEEFLFPILDKITDTFGAVVPVIKQISIALLILFALIRLNPFR